MPSASKTVFFRDLVFRVTENVYEPAEDSFLFAENLTVAYGSKVLDMGTGCGILGIIAAVEAGRVVAVDINPYAVRCAKENAELNDVAGKMFPMRGDLFGPIRLGEKFDLIVFNAPYLPSEEIEGDSWLEQAWAGGASGRKVIDNFIQKAPEYLKPDAEILLMQSTLSNVEETSQSLREKGFRATVVAQRDLALFETIVLLRASVMERK